MEDNLSDAQREFFRDSKVRHKDGRLRVMYHGSDSDFDEFDTPMAWFSTKIRYAREYGSRIYKCYLNCKRWLNCGNTSAPIYDWKETPGDVYGDLDDLMRMGSDIDGMDPDDVAPAADRRKIVLSSAAKEFRRRCGMGAREFEELLRKVVGDYASESDPMGTELRIDAITRSDDFKRFAESKGYDSLLVVEGDTQCIAVFHPEDIKLVTNRNPTNSKRIDEGVSGEGPKSFRRSKVRDSAGRLLKVYHGSDSEIGEFDPDRIGTGEGDNQFGRGFYFTSSRDEASSYGPVVGAYYLNLENPFRYDDHTFGEVLGIVEKANEMGYFGDGVSDGSLKSRLRKLDWRSPYLMDDVLDRLACREYADVTWYDAISGILMSLGYDGAVAPDGEYVAFRPDQIAKADGGASVDEGVGADGGKTAQDVAAEYGVSDDFEPYGVGYILPDGRFINLERYHGEEVEGATPAEYKAYVKRIGDAGLIEYSATHLEEDTAVRLRDSSPTSRQYDSMGRFIKWALDNAGYVKVEISSSSDREGILAYRAFVVNGRIGRLSHEALSHEAHYGLDVSEGNWTAPDIIHWIKDYIAARGHSVSLGEASLSHVDRDEVLSVLDAYTTAYEGGREIPYACKANAIGDVYGMDDSEVAEFAEEHGYGVKRDDDGSYTVYKHGAEWVASDDGSPARRR